MEKLNGVIESQQFTREIIDVVFETALKMKTNQESNLLKGKIMAAVFYEPSTRTRLSFEAAMRRLGGQSISTENARQFSSAAKGESLEDTVRVVSSYADIIVLRYDKQGGAERAQRFLGFRSSMLVMVPDNIRPRRCLISIRSEKRSGRLKV